MTKSRLPRIKRRVSEFLSSEEVLSEFDPDMSVVLDGGETPRVLSLGEILPEAFRFNG